MRHEPPQLRSIRYLLCSLTLAFLMACQSVPKQPIRTADHVDLDRFMGDWYVIANIPTRIEKDAYNAVESYERMESDKVKTIFTFREGGFDGERKRYEPTGFVKDTESNAVWGMRFVWPFKADYRIVFIDDAYSHTIIGRQKRDYVWIMSRKPQIPDEDYQKLVAIVVEQGYDAQELRKVPQRWD